MKEFPSIVDGARGYADRAAPCAPLAEVVAQQEVSTMELQVRLKGLLAPMERAGFTGNLTITFRKADNLRMSRIKSVEIVQM